MSFRITKDNLQPLKDAMDELVGTWEDIGDNVGTWLDLSQQDTLSRDERDAKREARENFEDRLDDLVSNLRSALEAYAAGEAKPGPTRVRAVARSVAPPSGASQ